MKPLGIVRRLDQLGRVVIPMEVRRIAGWVEGTPLEIFAFEDGILLKKYQPKQETSEVIEVLKAALDGKKPSKKDIQKAISLLEQK